MAAMYWPDVPRALHYAETSNRRVSCRFGRRYRWANKFGSEYDAVLEVGPLFKAMPRSEVRALCAAIDCELRKMYPRMAGSELPLLILADALEAGGARWIALEVRQKVGDWFVFLRRLRKAADDYAARSKLAEAERAD